MQLTQHVAPAGVLHVIPSHAHNIRDAVPLCVCQCLVLTVHGSLHAMRHSQRVASQQDAGPTVCMPMPMPCVDSARIFECALSEGCQQHSAKLVC